MSLSLALPSKKCFHGYLCLLQGAMRRQIHSHGSRYNRLAQLSRRSVEKRGLLNGSARASASRLYPLADREHCRIGPRTGTVPPGDPAYREAFVICNHGLRGDFYGGVIGSGSDSAAYGGSSCGRCNVLSSLPCDSTNPVLRSRYKKQHSNMDNTLATGNSELSRMLVQSCLRGYSGLGSLCRTDANWIIVRSFHRSCAVQKEESKAEQTVQALKDEVDKQKLDATAAESPPLDLPTPAPGEPEPTAVASRDKPDDKVAPSAITETKEVASPKKSIGQRIVAEVKHYYHGFRLLFIDMRVALQFCWKILNGKSLSRRERRQLVRTTSDMFRLVPFLVFVIVPFMEFLLPVALKLFPTMLPSTFKEENKEQVKLRKKLKVKLEMAKFLQDTIEDTALQRKGAKGESSLEFVEFMSKIRSTGTQTSNEAIMKYSKLFEDEITLDNLQYAPLRALCRLLELPTVGTSNFLRFQLRMKLRQLEADDQMIKKEGVDSMAVWELQEACRSRGMRSLGVPESRLKSQLSQWLDLHLNEKIPTSLLLLSRALYLPEQLSTEEQLKATISTLPETTAEEAKVKISEVAGDRVDNKTKLELIKQEQEAIRKEEEEERLKVQEGEVKAKEEEERLKAEGQEEVKIKDEGIEEVIKDAAEPITPSMVDSAPEMVAKPEEILVDKATSLNDRPADTAAESAATAAAATVEEEISHEELETIEDVLELVSEEKDKGALEKEELEALKEDVSEYKEALEDLKGVVVASGGRAEDLQESKASQRLSKRVNRMILSIGSLTDELHKEKDAILEEIELREVRIKHATNAADDERRREMLDQITVKKSNIVGINELILAMRRLQKVPDDTKIQKIAQVLDEDKDGIIDITDALRVMELLGKENVSIQTAQMQEIMDLLHKEQQVVQLEKQRKRREKEEKQQQ